MKLVVTAVAVGLLMRVAQFVLQRARTPAPKNETVLVGTGVIVFLLLTDAINDTPTAIAYAVVLVAAYCVSRLANTWFK